MENISKNWKTLIYWWEKNCDKVEIELDESFDLNYGYQDSCDCIKDGKQRQLTYPYSIEKNIDFLTEKINLNNLFYDEVDVEDPNINQYKIIFNFRDDYFKVLADYNYLKENDSLSYTFEFKNSPEISKIFENYIENGINGKWKVSFDGYGDSGTIEDFMRKDGVISSVMDDLLDLLYETLGNKHSGWEINEGSFGNFIIDFDEKIIELEYTEREDIYDTTSIYQSSIADLVSMIGIDD